MVKINYTHRTSRTGRPVNAPTGSVRKKLELSLLGKKKQEARSKRKENKQNKNKTKNLKQNQKQ